MLGLMLHYSIQCVGLQENLSLIAGGRNVINLTDGCNKILLKNP